MKTTIPGLVIRETCITDLNSIYKLGLEEPLFSSMTNWNAAALADAFCSTDLLAYTAARKKEVLGFIIGRISGDSAEILWILVKQKLRKRGIGSSLLDTFVNLSKKGGLMNFLVALLPDKTETEAFFYKRNMIQRESFIRLSGKL
ncbi:MAG TPA: GNAT family N-acetyltransferase [Spirochaetota bacterium]|nr:GNAT family N-acetyltransferase [Spirochaetota bacterium]